MRQPFVRPKHGPRLTRRARGEEDVAWIAGRYRWKRGRFEFMCLPDWGCRFRVDDRHRRTAFLIQLIIILSEAADIKHALPACERDQSSQAARRTTRATPVDSSPAEKRR